ncbi:MAG: hypothetical protein WBJ62_07500 [Coriobacteriia bacterium]
MAAKEVALLVASLVWLAAVLITGRRRQMVMGETPSQQAWSMALRWGFAVSAGEAVVAAVPTVYSMVFERAAVTDSGLLLYLLLLALVPGPVFAFVLFRASRAAR